MVIATKLSTRPLSDALGAEIEGIDIRAIDEQEAQQIRDIWHENLIILFRNQDLTEEEQVKFGLIFGGGSLTSGLVPEMEAAQGVVYVTNDRVDGKQVGILPDGEMQFHSDQCYIERPSKGTMLYAIHVPSQGGNTLFANMYAAYDTLPADVKARLAGLKALNVYDARLNTTLRGYTPEGSPGWVHPVVRTHPATNRKALYINRLMTAHIEGMPKAESDELLEFLFNHIEQPQFIYEHVWRPGDALLWDNRCALHARTDFPASERRRLRRITLHAETVR